MKWVVSSSSLSRFEAFRGPEARPRDAEILMWPRRRRHDALVPKFKTLSQHVCAENVIVSGINSAGAERPSHFDTPCKYWEMLTVLPVPVAPTMRQW